jgi:hypothetical protein
MIIPDFVFPLMCLVCKSTDKGFGYFFYSMRRDPALPLGPDEHLPERNTAASSAISSNEQVAADTAGEGDAEDGGQLSIDL